MKTLIILVFLIAAIVIIAKLKSAQKAPSVTAKQPPVYAYGRKQYLMTKAENEFFIVLKEILGARYQIFPQVHLTALLDQKKLTGQNWEAAFRHINGKSVDFVVCDQAFARPLIAIELDDHSHDTAGRRNRDAEVERMFRTANLPLLRFRDYKAMSRSLLATQLEATLTNADTVL